MLLSIGTIIQQRRKQLAITQRHLAELAAVNINTIYKIERNEANPTLSVLNQVATVLGMELKMTVKQVD
jgi:transcriptional regulator with XRE-family HTH domain